MRLGQSYTTGDTPRRANQGVLTLFGRHVVQTGDTTPEHGRFLNMLMNERRTADYEHAPISIDPDEVYEDVECFIEEMGELIDDTDRG